MNKIIVGIIFVVLFMVLQSSVSAFEISDADIFITPQDTASKYFGGYIGGVDAGGIDWAIGNAVPPSGSKTKDIVFSTCRGNRLLPWNWKEQFRITHGGPVLMSPDGTKWILSVDNFGTVIATLKE